MQKFIAILIGCSLTLAVGVRAAEQVEQTDVKKKPEQKSKTVQKQQLTPKQHTVPNTHVQTLHTEHANVHNNRVNTNVHKNADTNVHKNVDINVHNNVNADVSKKHLNTVPAVQSEKLSAVQSNKINKETVKKIHSQHLNFHAKPNAAIVSAKFNQNYQIKGALNWNGPKYSVFKSYHPQWHDKGWWHSHHNHLLLIGGGWYYWNGGYWYPAWGYDESAAYYPYDGPIYSGPNARPLDQVVADVQSALQEQGYYKGEVDGLVGPLTQEALAAFQSAQGLEPTEAIDEPTLAALGLS